MFAAETANLIFRMSSGRGERKPSGARAGEPSPDPGTRRNQEAGRSSDFSKKPAASMGEALSTSRSTM